MSTQKTGQEIKENHIDQYGADLGLALFYIHQQWCTLYCSFKQYANLFAKDSNRVALLNENGAHFFNNVQLHFFNGILLSICRLTDPETTGKKSNLTIQMLPQLVQDIALKSNVQLVVENAIDKSSFARERRNKKISHSDLGISTKEAEFVEIATLEIIRDAILAIHEPYRLIRRTIEDTDCQPIVIDSRAEFKLLRSLYESKFGDELLSAETKNRYNKREYDYEPYPKWLFNEDEEMNWR